jgi:hypothetical protein
MEFEKVEPYKGNVLIKNRLAFVEPIEQYGDWVGLIAIMQEFGITEDNQIVARSGAYNRFRHPEEIDHWFVLDMEQFFGMPLSNHAMEVLIKEYERKETLKELTTEETLAFVRSKIKNFDILYKENKEDG